MVFVDYKVTWIPRRNNNWDPSDAEDITGIMDPLVNRSLGTSRDTFSFKILNHGQINGKFNPTDKVLISRAVNSTVHDSDTLIMTGLIRNEAETINNQRDELRVEGYSFSEVMLNAITFIDATNLPINEALQEAVEKVQLYSEGFVIEWSDDNPTERLDGTPFPAVGMRWFNRRLGDLFERYSNRIYTGEPVNYYFAMDEKNELVWKPQEDASEGTFNSDTDIYVSLKDGKDVNEVVNFVIIKGGFDPAGNQLQWRYQDFASSNKHGIKFKVIPTIAKNAQILIKQDMNSLGVTTGTMPSVALGGTYNFTCTWKSSVTGNFETVNNDAEYVEVLRAHVLKVLQDEAFEYVESRRYGRFKLTLEFKPGTRTWVPGSLITCTLPNIFTTPKNLRVRGVQYGAEKDVFELMEDEGTI